MPQLFAFSVQQGSISNGGSEMHKIGQNALVRSRSLETSNGNIPSPLEEPQSLPLFERRQIEGVVRFIKGAISSA
jgi:hypothetical protein